MQKLYETKGLTIQDLSAVKKDLKQRMDIQQEQVFTSAKRLVPFTKDSTTINLNKKSLSPLSLITTPMRKGKTISIVEGVLIGYKLMKNARRLFRR
jgi:hypothetical protein